MRKSRQTKLFPNKGRLVAVLAAGMALALALWGCGDEPTSHLGTSDSDEMRTIQKWTQVRRILNKAKQGSVRVLARLTLSDRSTTSSGSRSTLAGSALRRRIIEVRQKLLRELRQQRAKAYANYKTVPLVALKVDRAGLEKMAESGLVASIQEDGLNKPTLASAMPHVGAAATWQHGWGGAGQTVVILDTGIDADHEFLGNRVVDEACWSNAGGAGAGESLCGNGNTSQTGRGAADAESTNCVNGVGTLCNHGTHVAGIAAGRRAAVTPGGANGVAPEANIIAIQVFTRFNSAAACGGPAPCLQAYDSDIISALDYVNTTLRRDWSIASVNMSLGGGHHTAACDGSAYKPAIDNLVNGGIATVIASGNNGWTDALASPGCVSTAVTVGSVTDGNTCGSADGVSGYSNAHDVVDLLTVGSCVTSSIVGGNYATWNGTSMATPQVAGAFATMRARSPNMSVADILDALQNTGVRVTDNRAASPPNANTGQVTRRLQLDAACGLVARRCGPKAIRKENTGWWVQVDLPQRGSGTTITFKDGAHGGYKFPLCRRIRWKDLKSTCRDGEWQQSGSLWTTAHCAIRKNTDQPYLTVGKN